MGSNATLVAIPWYVLVTTGSPFRVGLAARTALAGEVLSGLFASAVVDRVGLRRASPGRRRGVRRRAGAAELDLRVRVPGIALGPRLPRRPTFNVSFVLLAVFYTAVGLAPSPAVRWPAASPCAA